MLKGYGFDGILLKWLEDFLSERRQRVILNGEESEWVPVTSGIPQGSVLSPMLFIIYTNDMPETVRSMCKLFADDSKLYLTIKSRNEQEIIQSDLFKIYDWSKEWLMPFNIASARQCIMEKKPNLASFIK